MIEKSWLSLVKYSTKFLWFYSNIFDKDKKIEKLNFLNIKFIFINIGLYFSFLLIF